MAGVSKRLIASYLFDWIIIILFAAVGGGLNSVKGYERPFSLLDLNISYPYVPELISTGTLVLVSLVAPVVIIAVVTAIFVPGRGYSHLKTRSENLRLKLWELEQGLAGLCLSVAVAFFITQGAKNLFGKPRPDLLARCQPDPSTVAKYVVGGYGQDLSALWTMVDSSICTNKDATVLQDGFRSFPSGHSSFSWSGLLYLSLFLCSKLSIAVPFLPPPAQGGHPAAVPLRSSDAELLPLHQQSSTHGSAEAGPLPKGDGVLNDTTIYIARNLAASPPNYLIVFPLIPICTAVYICSTRYAQFYHFGFDIISGALIGILTSWFSFRWYHLPLGRGQGWAWAPRSSGKAFAIGVGTSNYIDD